MASGIRQVVEKSHTYHDGTEAYLKIHAFPVIGQNGKANGFIEVAENITEAKKAEEALKETNQRLEMAIAEANEMAERAQAANQAKSEFLANMSHEIRTPMNGIIGMTGLALGTNLTREQREYLEMVKISANSLLAVLNDVLDLSKIEAGKIELQEIDFDLRTTVEGATEIVAVKAGEAMLELTCRIKPEVPTALVGDPSRLRQVLVNLVGNAVKFTEEGEIGIEVKTETEEDSSVLLHFIVSDTGIGISPDKLETIFESFQQADGSITRKYEGTGLGLSISKQLVELMGGGIWVESEFGKGSIFHFTARFGLSRKDVSEALSFMDLDLSGLRVLIETRKSFRSSAACWKARCWPRSAWNRSWRPCRARTS